jgi:hypothetical protein
MPLRRSTSLSAWVPEAQDALEHLALAGLGEAGVAAIPFGDQVAEEPPRLSSGLSVFDRAVTSAARSAAQSPVPMADSTSWAMRRASRLWRGRAAASWRRARSGKISSGGVPAISW